MDARAICTPAGLFLEGKETQNQKWNPMSQLFEGFSRATIRQSQQDIVPIEMVPAELVSPELLETVEVGGVAKSQGAGIAGAVESKKMAESDNTMTVIVQPASTARLVAWMNQ
jgi:hypothetical protein